MRKTSRCTALALALLCSVGLAAAAEGEAAKSRPLYLSTAQEQLICRNLTKEIGQSIPSDFRASVGAKVPQSLSLHQLPSKLADRIPTARMYEYAKLQDDTILLVDPEDREVADVIIQPSTASNGT